MGKTCACICLFFILFLGIPVAIALLFWLVVFPARFSFSVEEASVNGFHLANDGRLNSTFNLVIRSYDPSYSQNYQDVKVYILKENEILVQQFDHVIVNVSHTTKNEDRMKPRLVAVNAPLEDSVVEKLRSESEEGVLKLGINMRGVLNMYDHVEVKCRNVLVNIVVSSSSSKIKFRRRKCHVHRHGGLFEDSN